MLELRFPPLHRLDHQYPTVLRQVIAEVLDIQRQNGNRAGNQAVIDKIGMIAGFERDEGYWGEALDYHLGILYAHARDPEKASYHFDRSGTHPSSGGNQFFSDHQRESLELRRRQELAMERSVPSLIIASLPRSGSASLTQTLGAALDAPIMRVSSVWYLVPRWLNSFSRGGAVLHDHFAASPFNLKTLREGGVRTVFVRARDPRAAAASTANMHERRFGVSDNASYEDRVLRLCQQTYIPWIMDWIAAASSTVADPKIHWLVQPSNAIRDAAREILTTSSSEHPILEQYVRAGFSEVKANFVTGDQDAWRKRISPRGQERLWDSIPQNVKALLALER
jgi:hypothetical protein